MLSLAPKRLERREKNSGRAKQPCRALTEISRATFYKPGIHPPGKLSQPARSPCLFFPELRHSSWRALNRPEGDRFQIYSSEGDEVGVTRAIQLQHQQSGTKNLRQQLRAGRLLSQL